MNENRCVCCGAVIPEGRMVCPNCYEREWMIDQIPESTQGFSGFRKIIRTIKGIFLSVSRVFSSSMSGWLSRENAGFNTLKDRRK